MYCLWCHRQIVLDLNWQRLIFLRKPVRLCKVCQPQLKQLSGHQCIRCGRMGQSSICDDCSRWSRYFNDQDVLTANRSIFVYNSMMQEIVTKWKYRGDYVLGSVFWPYVDRFFREYRHIYPKKSLLYLFL